VIQTHRRLAASGALSRLVDEIAPTPSVNAALPNTSSGSSIISAEQRGSAQATLTTGSSAPLVAQGSTGIVEARRIPMCETNEQVADSLDSESTVRATPLEDALWSEVVTRAVA
jgi:hypothetical protein